MWTKKKYTAIGNHRQVGLQKDLMLEEESPCDIVVKEIMVSLSSVYKSKTVYFFCKTHIIAGRKHIVDILGKYTLCVPQ